MSVENGKILNDCFIEVKQLTEVIYKKLCIHTCGFAPWGRIGPSILLLCVRGVKLGKDRIVEYVYAVNVIKAAETV